MSSCPATEPVVPLDRGRFVYDLERQAAALAPLAPAQLVVSCDDCGRAGAGWRRDLLAPLFLPTAGATVTGPGVREAIRFAVEELGVREVLVVSHSHCEQLLPAPARTAMAGGSFMDRLYGRMAHSSRQLDAARHHVRTALGRLAGDPRLGDVALLGAVHLVESGVLLGYDPETDDYEAVA